MANRGLFTFALLFLGLGLLFAGANVGYQQAVTDFNETNESITVDYSQTVQVDQTGDAFSYNDTVTVYNSSDAELVEGDDYTWYASNGSVAWFDTANTTDGEQASISYDYTAPPESNRAMGGVLKAVGIGLTMLLVLLVGQWIFDVVGDW